MAEKMETWDGIKDGRELWKTWQMLLDQTLAYKNSNRFLRMPEKQQQDYLKTMHQRLQSVNDAAHDKDMEYIKKIKANYGIQ